MTDLETLQKRNARVEADKAWETSRTRKVVIAFGTYLIIGGYLNYLKVEQAWLHAVVPVMAYILSTLGLGYLKLIWIERIYKHGDQ